MATPTADNYSAPAGTTSVRGGRGTPSSPPQSGFSITAPSSGMAKVLSTPIKLSYVGVLASPVAFTFADNASGKVWSMGSEAVNTVTLPAGTNPVAYCYYDPASVGAKTITMTNNGGLTNPAGISYTAIAQTGSATPFRLTRAGVTIGSYARLQQCRDNGLWQSGDVIYVAGGTYAMSDDTLSPGSMSIRDNYPGGIEVGINIDTLTIQAEDMNNPPFIDFSGWCAAGVRGGGQPQALTAGIPCHTVTVRGIRFRGSAAVHGSTVISAAFWQLTDFPANDGSTATFTFDRCLLQGWGDAVKGRNHRSSSWYFNSCVFIDNSDAAAGLHHDIYVDTCALVEVVGCTFRRTGLAGYFQESYGHFVKNRGRVTTVKACMFDAYKTAGHLGGANSLINTPSGGVVTIVGNILLDYGPQSNGSAHNILRSAEQQFPSSGEPSTDPLMNTHSYLIAQNTTWQMLGYPPDGNTSRVLAMYHIPSNDPNGAVSVTGVPTYAMTGSGTMVPVTTIIQNNIVAHEASARATEFLTGFPNNSVVGVSEISAAGHYSGAVIAGSPAVNDADLEWAGDYMVPIARSDTNRGGRTPSNIPSWVPATAWQWTPITGTIWGETMRSTDSGGVAPSQAGDPVGAEYFAQWDYGGVAYSPKNHEMWMFGGGHDGTTINALSRWNLGSNSPSVSMMCPPTPVAVRLAEWGGSSAAYMAAAYHGAGSGAAARPKSPHAYSNNRYFDDTDHFVSLGLGAVDEPGGGSFGPLAVPAFHRSASEWQAQNYLPDINSAGSYGVQAQMVFEAIDRSSLYYAGKNSPLYRITSAGVKTTIGSDVGNCYVAHGAAQSTTQALIVGGIELAQGWRARFLNLTTGAVTTATVSGRAWPTDMGDTMNCRGMVWSAALGKYFVLLTAGNGALNPNLGALRLITLEPTGASTLTAAEITLTGTAPIHMVLGTCLHIDPSYGVLLIATNSQQTLMAIKIG